MLYSQIIQLKQREKYGKQEPINLSAINATEGKSISVVGDTYRIVIGGEHTDHKYALIDMLIPPQGGPGPHSHAGVQEAFDIPDGEIEVVTKEKYTRLQRVLI